MPAIQTITSRNPGQPETTAPGPCLQGPSRPRFFRDQLLTDQDLGALVTWAQARFGLGRFVHGWGVVCGLDVGIDPEDPTSIRLGAGYAIDGLGRDIVVPKPATQSVAQVCPPPAGTCGRPAEEGEEVETHFGLENTHIFDLYLVYDESKSDARHVPRRGTCQSGSGCEYARANEWYRLEFRCVAESEEDEPDPDASLPAGYAKWREDAKALVNDLVRMVGPDHSSLDDIQKRLRRWIGPDAYPPYQLGFLPDAIDALGPEVDPNAVARLALLLLQDGRARLLGCACPGCDGEDGVLLARLYVQSVTGPMGQSSCRVVGIDAATPDHRRPLRKAPCRPVPPERVDLASWIWQPLVGRRDPALPHALAELLANWDITARVAPLQGSLDDPAEFQRMIDADLSYPAGAVVEVLSFEADELGNRIVAFAPAGEG